MLPMPMPTNLPRSKKTTKIRFHSKLELDLASDTLNIKNKKQIVVRCGLFDLLSNKPFFYWFYWLKINSRRTEAGTFWTTLMEPVRWKLRTLGFWVNSSERERERPLLYLLWHDRANNNIFKDFEKDLDLPKIKNEGLGSAVAVTDSRMQTGNRQTRSTSNRSRENEHWQLRASLCSSLRLIKWFWFCFPFDLLKKNKAIISNRVEINKLFEQTLGVFLFLSLFSFATFFFFKSYSKPKYADSEPPVSSNWAFASHSHSHSTRRCLGACNGRPLLATSSKTKLEQSGRWMQLLLGPKPGAFTRNRSTRALVEHPTRTKLNLKTCYLRTNSERTENAVIQTSSMFDYSTRALRSDTGERRAHLEHLDK